MTKREREMLELIKRKLLEYNCHVEYGGITRGSHVMFRVVHDKTGESRKLFTGFSPSCHCVHAKVVNQAKHLAIQLGTQ
jgi:hypothetical protein